MQRHKKLSARILSVALTVAMVCTMMPSTVFAAESDVPLGASSLGASAIGTIRSFEKLEDRFEPSTGEGASKDVYALNVELNTPFEDLNLPDELTAMVARTTTVSAPAEDEPVVDSGKPSEPAEDEVIPDEDKVVDEDTTTDDTVSGNQPASPSDAEENPEIPDEDVPLAPEPEDEETVVTTTEQEIISVTWQSDKEYKSDENGRFIYTSVLPEGYILADGVKLPQIYVLVGEQEQSICADTAESNALLDRLLALTAEQQVMIDEGGADVTSTDRFKALAVEIDELYAHVDVCGICAAQMAEGGAYYEKFYPAQTMEAGNVVAKIGENTYTSLQDAFTAVADGETIIIQQAITQNTSISKIISDSVVDFTLDLNGFDVTITANNVAPYHAINLQGKNANERSSMTITDLGGNSTLGKLTVSGALGTKTGEGSGIQGNNFNIIISKIEVEATGTILDAGAINGNITINEGAIVSAKGRVGMMGTKLIIDGATVTAEGIDNNKSNTAGITFTDVKIIDSDVTAIATGSAEILSIGIQASGSLEIINSTVNITATSPKASTGINLMGTNNSITNSTVNINSGSNGVAMTKGPVLDVTTGQNLGAWYSDKVTYAPLNGDTGYTVTFDAGTNGSTILSGSTGKRVAVLNNVKNGTTFAVPPKNPTNLNSNRTFEGWFTSTDGGTTLNNTAWNFDTDTVTADMTLYAKWSGTGIDAEKPVITSDLSTTAVKYSQNASTYPLKIVASVTDGGTLSYQWYSNSANNTTSGSIISGATNDTFSPPTTTTATTYYYCIVTNTISNSSGGQETNSTTSKIALIIVDGKENAVPPLIGDNLSTTEVTYVVGATASPLSITASTIDSGTISYQWYKSTINNTSTNASVATAIGTNANTYTPPTTTAGTLYYFCYVTNTITDNSDGGLKTISIPSKIAKITVDATFVPVTNITGVPTTATAGTALSLTGTVAPTTATNKTIVWSVKSAGATGATISGSTLNTTAAGTVTVTATITNGLTGSSNYTKDFTITVNAAASGGEQFNFPLGGTYYFDLSGEAGTITSGVSDKMGTINTSLPDATMHYVPFTYVGTVNAYSLDSSSSGQTGASAAATASNRSLFVADYNVSTTISWDSLNTNGLVFGNTFDTNYKLRSLSVGSSEVNSKGSPSTNEWDTILDKTAVTNPIKNWTGIYSWGQDTYSGDTAIRAARGHNTSARKWGRNPSTAPAAVIGYRPALEVLNVDSLNAVELDWNGGKFNNSTDSIKIVCAGGTFIAPGSTGLTAPTDKTAKATFWNTAADGSGTSYAAGASVPNTVTKLYAQWEDEAATFVPVTGITGVPNTATAGTPLTLSGTVAPTNATNKTIVWTVKSAGATGATISGSTLNTTAAGTVTVTATITNGLTASSNYSQDFTITVNAVAPTHKPVTNITGVPTTAVAGTDLTLTGTVAPTDATNKTIVWSVNSAGATNATITGNTLKTTAAGTVTVTATITNGLTASSNYTQDFTITVSKSDAQKLAAAKLLAEAAVTNLTATNATTAAGILSTVNTAINSVTGVTATWKSGSPTITPATDSAAGSITGTIVLTCGSATVEVTVNKPIAQLGSDAEKVANAKAAAVAALNSYTATNATADGDIMALVNNAITDAGITGITAAWKSGSGFDKTNATASATGSVTGTITLKLNSAEQDVVVNLTIAQLADKAALTAKINEANNAKSGITVSDNAASSVTSGVKFVTTAEMKALTDAIAAAQAIANNPASTADQVSAAITTLNNAVATFNAAIKTGTYSGGGGGGGGGSSSGGSSTTPPTKTEPVSGTSNTTATVDKNGNATTTVTDKNIADAVQAAKDAANKKGVNAGEVTAVINVTSPANSNPNTVTVNLPKTVQQQVINNKIDNVAIVIDKPDISIGMNLATITEMNKQANADIQLSATRTDATKLSTEAKNAIGNRPAFDLKATYNSGAKSITSFGTGSVSVAIPYTLQSGEVAGGLYAVYIDGNGKANYITGSSYDANAKMLRFATNHFSVYGIGYKAPSAFTDIAGHWAKTDIEFVVNRGLMSGTSNTTFAPNGSMTRGMFVTALGRLAGVDTNSYKTGKFTDVKADAYYAPYVNWAAEKGITNGTTATTFSPDSTVTRQEMAVFMSNYAKAMGYKVPETREAVTFADNGSIGSWAAAAVKQMQMAGVLNGKNGNKFDPTGTATRGEIAALLHRYVELVIDRSTAQGLDTNDSGSAMMYENGKAVKSASRTVGSSTYNFNANGEAALLPADNKKTGTYTVQKGDSFWLIAKKVGCTMADLEQLNGKSRYDTIYAGQTLKVPQK